MVFEINIITDARIWYCILKYNKPSKMTISLCINYSSSTMWRAIQYYSKIIFSKCKLNGTRIKCEEDNHEKLFHKLEISFCIGLNIVGHHAQDAKNGCAIRPGITTKRMTKKSNADEHKRKKPNCCNADSSVNNKLPNVITIIIPPVSIEVPVDRL